MREVHLTVNRLPEPSKQLQAGATWAEGILSGWQLVVHNWNSPGDPEPSAGTSP